MTDPKKDGPMFAALLVLLAASGASSLLRRSEEQALRQNADSGFSADELCVGWTLAPDKPVGLVCAPDVTRIPAALERRFGRFEDCARLTIDGEVVPGQMMTLERLEGGRCHLTPKGRLPGPLRLLAHGKIRPNSDDAADLRALPGIGEIRAETIVEERQKGGPFKDGDDLQRRVRGIGPKTLERIAPLISFGDAPSDTF